MNVEFPKKNREDVTNPWGHDSRVFLHPQTECHAFKGPDGISYEYDDDKNAWFPMYDEALVKAQQSIYSVQGVDEEEYIAPKRNSKKSNGEGPAAKKARPEKKTRAVYVTGLPPDATVDEIKELFEKYGLILEDINTGLPKIKLYKDEQGNPKGDALITYFKPESVDLCVRLLDDSAFRYNQPGTIRVQPAVFAEKPGNEATGTTSSSTKTSGSGNKADKKRLERARLKLEKKLEWFGEDEGTQVSERLAKVVILKHMFTLEELKEDPTLLLDLKTDVQEECEKFGPVISVALYDLEPEGIMTVKFRELESARACVQRMNGRFFAKRQMLAYQMEKKEKFRQSSSRLAGADEEAEEEARLRAYEDWLDQQE